MAPYAKDRPEVFDFSDANMYSEAVAQLVRWQQHYCRFWKNSALFCDLKWPDLFNTNTPNREGATGIDDAGEQVFWNAVTGDKLTLEDGIELGRRIWNLDNAIWVLQGRHRDIVHFAPYIYETKYEKNELFPVLHVALPGREGQVGLHRPDGPLARQGQGSRNGRRSSTRSRAGTPRPAGRRPARSPS